MLEIRPIDKSSSSINASCGGSGNKKKGGWGGVREGERKRKSVRAQRTERENDVRGRGTSFQIEL